MACAIRLLQLLEDDPALMESLGEVPVAVIEKGRVAGAHQLSGRRDEPERDPAPVPGRRLLAALRGGGQGDRLLHAQPQAGDPAEADAAAVPQPRQLRRLRRRAQPLAGREGRGGRRLRPVRDGRREAARRGRCDGRRAHGRQGPRQAGRGEGQLRARRRRDRQGDRARRGLLGPPHRRGAQGPGPRGHRPAGVGARRQGGVGGRAAARPRDPHARLAAAPAGASTRSSAARGSTR